jgi:hypothetical protein
VDCLHTHRGITLTALPRGQWFCSPACRGVHRALQRMCARGQVKGDGMAAGYTWQLLKSAQTAVGGGARGGAAGEAGGAKQRARPGQRPESPLGHALAVLQVGAFAFHTSSLRRVSHQGRGSVCSPSEAAALLGAWSRRSSKFSLESSWQPLWNAWDFLALASGLLHCATGFEALFEPGLVGSQSTLRFKPHGRGNEAHGDEVCLTFAATCVCVCVCV